MPQSFFDGKSSLVQVMAWCLTAPSHYLNQWWPRFCCWMASLGRIELTLMQKKGHFILLNDWMGIWWIWHLNLFVYIPCSMWHGICHPGGGGGGGGACWHNDRHISNWLWVWVCSVTCLKFFQKYYKNAPYAGLQGSPFLKIITCPTPIILKFFDLLISQVQNQTW